MEVIRSVAPIPPSWWTGGCGISLPLNVKTSRDHIFVKRTSPSEDLLSFASSVPVNSRSSVEAMIQGTRIRLIEMRVKLMHKLPKLLDSGRGQAGLIVLTGATDLDRRHRVTLENTLGSDEDKQTASAFISTKLASRISWGIALSHKLQQAVTLFARFNSDESSRHRFILQIVQKVGERNTFSPILSKILRHQPQAGLSWTHQLSETGRPGQNSVQVKLFWSGSGAYSVRVKAQAGELDGF